MMSYVWQRPSIPSNWVVAGRHRNYATDPSCPPSSSFLIHARCPRTGSSGNFFECSRWDCHEEPTLSHDDIGEGESDRRSNRRHCHAADTDHSEEVLVSCVSSLPGASVDGYLPTRALDVQEADTVGALATLREGIAKHGLNSSDGSHPLTIKGPWP